MQNAHTTSPAKPPSNLLPVLVATRQTQGRRSNDFCWCDEGEPVRFATECDREGVDGRCGCRRSMSGMTTLRATTTVRVQLLPITRGEFVAMLKDSLVRSGYAPFVKQQDVEGEAEELLHLAAAFPAGAVLEKRGDRLCVRAGGGRTR